MPIWIEMPDTEEARLDRLEELETRLAAIEQEWGLIFAEIEAIRRSLGNVWTFPYNPKVGVNEDA